MAKKEIKKEAKIVEKKPPQIAKKNLVGGRLGVIEKGTEAEIFPGTPE